MGREKGAMGEGEMGEGAGSRGGREQGAMGEEAGSNGGVLYCFFCHFSTF
jgi:hypothetical protein